LTGESLLLPRRASYGAEWFDVALMIYLSQPEVKSQALTHCIPPDLKNDVARATGNLFA